ncbi:hypothetical protein [Schaedlerella sp.]|uniref:hypothetical protein n=1 Tax=Schaedlerella sp. TaxID=2676057 RepID=UPI003746A2F2
MYKPVDKSQHSFLDFNQPMGLHMNPDNRWIKHADLIPWQARRNRQPLISKKRALSYL